MESAIDPSVSGSPTSSSSFFKPWVIVIIILILLLFLCLVLLFLCSGLCRRCVIILKNLIHPQKYSESVSVGHASSVSFTENTRILIQPPASSSSSNIDVSKLTTAHKVNLVSTTPHRRSISENLQPERDSSEENLPSKVQRRLSSYFLPQTRLSVDPGASTSTRLSQRSPSPSRGSGSRRISVESQHALLPPSQGREGRTLKTQRSELHLPSMTKNPFLSVQMSTVESAGPSSSQVMNEGMDHGLGKLHFSVSYDYGNSQLGVCIKEAIHLPAMDLNGKSDPFVQMYLLPDCKTKYRTHIKQRNLNPRWNEHFWFENFPKENLLSNSLHLQVKDYDRFTKNDNIGNVQYCLLALYEAEAPADFVKTEDIWRFIKPVGPRKKNLGELLVSLCYNASNAKLTVTILKARNLKPMDKSTNLADPYCVIHLKGSDGKTKELKKTTNKEKTIFPAWNEAFPFSLKPDKIKESFIQIKVMHKVRMGSELIGKLRLGGPQHCHSQEAVVHWNKMCSSPREITSQWHSLFK